MANRDGSSAQKGASGRACRRDASASDGLKPGGALCFHLCLLFGLRLTRGLQDLSALASGAQMGLPLLPFVFLLLASALGANGFQFFALPLTFLHGTLPPNRPRPLRHFPRAAARPDKHRHQARPVCAWRVACPDSDAKQQHHKVDQGQAGVGARSHFGSPGSLGHVRTLSGRC